MAFGLHSTIFSTLFSNVLVDVCCRMLLNGHASQVSDFFHFPLLSHCFWKYSYVTTYSLLFFWLTWKDCNHRAFGEGGFANKVSVSDNWFRMLHSSAEGIVRKYRGAIGNVNFFYHLYSSL